jgi:uncharacterized membrane protein YqjE
MNREDTGLLDALGRLGGRLFDTLQNRLELVSIELGEARERLLVTIIASFAAVLLFGGALVALSAWVVVTLWPALGAAVLVWLALVYALGGAGVLWWLRARGDSPPLADTLAELHNDAAFMRGQATVRDSTRGR